MLNLEPIAVRHIAWMRLSNKRETTIYARERTLLRLTRWAQGPILYLRPEQLAAFQEWRAAGDHEREPIGPASQRVEVSHLREFYGWAVREGLRTDDPTGRLVIPKRKDYAAHPLADVLLAEALRRADVHMAAILGLARFAGLRACEIARLDWRDVRLAAAEPILTVREGKGGYTRTVHCPRALVDLLRALPERSGPVIPRVDGSGQYNSAARISQRAAKFLHEQLGTEPGEALHALRHSFGTAMYQASLDLRAVQEEMGHRSVATTQIYTKVANRARAQAVEAAAELRLDESA